MRKKVEPVIILKGENPSALGKIYSEGEYLLDVIEREIKTKYSIHKPLFVFNFKKYFNKDDLIRRIDNIVSQKRWVKYKHLENNLFELKDFYPDPSDEICYKEALDSINEYENDVCFFEVGTVFYSKDEVLKIIINCLREGVSRIWIENELVNNTNLRTTKTTYKITFCEESEPEVDIESGFRQLENKY